MKDNVEEIAALVDLLIEAEKTSGGPTVFTRWHHAAEALHAAGYRKVEDDYEYGATWFQNSEGKFFPVYDYEWGTYEEAEREIQSAKNNGLSGMKIVKRRKGREEGSVEDAT